MGILRKTAPGAASLLRLVGTFAPNGDFQSAAAVTPRAVLDAIAEVLAPETLVLRAPASSWEYGKPRPASERYRIDDPEVRTVKRMVIGIEDEHGTMHVAFMGKFASAYFFDSIAQYPASEKRLLEGRRERAEERAKYDRENPVACGAERCSKRFRTEAGLRMHIAACVRRGRKAHAEYWEKRRDGR